jgi:hypothetical protein
MESEKEKMGTGRLYDANYDTELIAERQACKELCYELNRLRPSQITEREAIIRRLFHKTKSIFCWNNPFIAIMAIILRWREFLCQYELCHSGRSESSVR